MKENIVEYTNSLRSDMEIDEANGIVKNVKIVGLESKNGRIYPSETLKNSARLYENAKVNLNHPDGSPASIRKYQDRFGSIRNVYYRPNDGLYGVLHFNPKHVLAEQFLWDAKHCPQNLGMSHNVEAVVVQQDEKQVVEEIIAVRSVDVVADPATTQSLFESLSKDNKTTYENDENVKTLTEVDDEGFRAFGETQTVAYPNPSSDADYEISSIQNKANVYSKNAFEKQLKKTKILEMTLDCMLRECESYDSSNQLISQEFLQTLLETESTETVAQLLKERREFYRRIKTSLSTPITESARSRPSYPLQINNTEEFIESIKG